MRGLTVPCSRYARLSLGSSFGSGVRCSWRCFETVRMHPCCQPCVLEMHVDDITEMRTRCALMAPLCQNAASFSAPPRSGCSRLYRLKWVAACGYVHHFAAPR